MIGNKFAADEIARNFQKRLSKIQSLKKAASQEKSSSEGASHGVNPEDFLVELSVDNDSHERELDNAIKDVSSYAEDDSSMTSCAKCHVSYAKDSDHHCDEKDEDDSDEDDNEKEGQEEVVLLLEGPMSPMGLIEGLMNVQAKNILFELGKIASELRIEDNGFAADVVEATALDIINDLVKEAKKKAFVLDTLKKMASESYSRGDNITGDVILATANNIKNS